jgi:hypothetical protein
MRFTSAQLAGSGDGAELFGFGTSGFRVISLAKGEHTLS